LFAGQHKNQYGGPGFFLVAAGFRSGGDSPLTTNAKLYCWFSANVNGPTVSDKALFGLASMEDFGHRLGEYGGLRSFEATRTAFAVFGVQLCLNLAWSFLFFGLQRIDLALLEIVILLVAVIIMFWRIERLAGLLFVPYAAWVTYATILNASLWLLNKT
jgi:hypothetical protein